MKDLAANGSNLGNPPEEWKPVIGVTDFGLYEYYPSGDSTKEIGRYWDHSELRFVGSNEIWDKEKKQFVPNPHSKRKVKRKSKVGVYTRDKNGQLVDFDKSKETQSNMKVQGESVKKRTWWEKLLGIK